MIFGLFSYIYVSINYKIYKIPINNCIVIINYILLYFISMNSTKYKIAIF